MESENKKVKVDLVEQIKKAIIEGDVDLFEKLYFSVKRCERVNIKIALKEFVSNKKDVLSKQILGWIYQYGLGGIQRNFVKAIDCFYYGASKNFSLAFNSLGYIYSECKGFINIDLALKYFKKGYKLGRKTCGYNLACLYFDEFKDYEKALELWKEVAKKEDCKRAYFSKKDCRRAYFYIGRCYLKGLGVEPDFQKGIDYITRSASKGYKEAKEQLKNFIINGKVNAAELFLENQRLKKENEELKLRPPQVGGAEYLAAKKRFEEYI